MENLSPPKFCMYSDLLPVYVLWHSLLTVLLLYTVLVQTHSAVSEVPFETRAPSVVNNRAEGKADHATLLKLLNLHQYVVKNEGICMVKSWDVHFEFCIRAVSLF